MRDVSMYARHKLLSSVLTLAALGALGALASGCASTWVKRDGQAPAQPLETLNASMVVVSQAPGQGQDNAGSSAKGLATMLQNKDLDKFGDGARAMLEEAMLKQGFRLTLDKPRALRAGDSSLAKNKNMQTLSGVWAHPETSAYGFNGTYFDSGLVKVAQTLRDPERPQEHFASITVYVHEGSSFACGSVLGWFYPIITVDMRVLNNAGKEVYNSRIRGEGDSSFGVADRSPSNLTLGLKRALMKMNALEVKPL